MHKSIMFEIIKRRHSLRSYNGQNLSDGDRMELERRLDRSLENPFGAVVRLPLMEENKLEGQKLGTYGVIHGVELYIAGVARRSPMDIEGLGFALERAVLDATAMGLGTCWLAGTYNHAAFQKTANLTEDERLLIVSPVGYPADRRTLLDSMMHSVAGSAKRKPWSELFFDETPDRPLDEMKAANFIDVLEAVRLAPSAANGQPWRIIRQGDRFHFYRSAKQGSESGRIDMGIAACHFELVARESELDGDWVFKNPQIKIESGSWVYFASWACK